MKTEIVVKFNIEGLHAWPGVVENDKLKEAVGFLQFPHRHQFTFRATKQVSHADRDIEIIDLKRIMIHYLFTQYGKPPVPKAEGLYNSHCDFGNQSCEMIAQELVEKFELSSCEVLEDNENGAIVTVNQGEPIPPAMKKPYEEIEIADRIGKGARIVFLCGALCSGKSYYKKALLEQEQNNGYLALGMEASDIVKNILKKESRADLQGHPELDVEIVKAIDGMRDMSKDDSILIIVSGVRQKTILQAFPKSECIWVDASESIRYERFKNSKKDEDVSLLGFTQANERDNELGLTELKQYIFNRNK